MVSIAQKHKADVSGDVVAAGLRAFFEIKKKWGLTNAQAMVLLGAPRERVRYWIWQQGSVTCLASSKLLRSSINSLTLPTNGSANPIWFLVASLRWIA